MGPIWGRQDPGGPHVGPMNFAIWGSITHHTCSSSYNPVTLFIHENPCTTRNFFKILMADTPTLQWRHNGCGGVSNHQSHNGLLNSLFRSRSKNTSKLRVIELCAGNSPVIGEFPLQRACNLENVSIWWRHHDYDVIMTRAFFKILMTDTSISPSGERYANKLRTYCWPKWTKFVKGYTYKM